MYITNQMECLSFKSGHGIKDLKFMKEDMQTHVHKHAYIVYACVGVC